MKYCEEYAALLSAFVDGEVTDAERERVFAHLDTCADCRAYLADLIALRAAFDELDEVEAPENLTANVMAAVRAEKKSAPRRARRTVRYLGLAACAAVLVVSLRLLPASQAEKSTADCAAPAASPETVVTMTAAPANVYSADEEFPDEVYYEVQSSGVDCAEDKTKEFAFVEGMDLPLPAPTADEPAEGAAANSVYDRTNYIFTLYAAESGDVSAEGYLSQSSDVLATEEGTAYGFAVSALYELPEGLTLSEDDYALLSTLDSGEIVYVKAG